MANLVWAAKVVEKNYQAILSEGGAALGRDLLLAWVREYGEGYLILNTAAAAPLDCYLLQSEKFHGLYEFERGDEDAMFRIIIPKNKA